MKLTDIFRNDNSLADASKAVRPDNGKNTAPIDRQIRSLSPGQTLHGEVVSRNGNEVQIRVSDDFTLHARLDQNMNLEIGKSMTFEVRNNGRNLTLSPLFANTATDANTLKALDMAALPVNETTVSMTRQLMDAGLPIDKNSLQQVFREINSYPRAQVSDIVDLHRLGLPVNDANVEQVAAYKNMSYQIASGMSIVMEEIQNAVQGMAASGNLEGAGALYEELFALFEPGMAGMEIPPAEQEILAKILGWTLEENGQGQGGVPGDAVKGEGTTTQEAVVQNGEVQNAGAQGTESQGEVTVQGKMVFTLIEEESRAAGQDSYDKAMSLLQELSDKGQPQEEPDMLTGTHSLARELSALTGQKLPSNMSAQSLLRLSGQLMQRAVEQHDTKVLGQLLKSDSLKEVLGEKLNEMWRLKTEDVSDSRKVEDLYTRLDRQLKGLEQALEKNGQNATTAFKAVNNMSQNLNFLQQVNQMYAYVQLPLRFQQGDAHGDLYVYTNKKNLAARDGKISALLHLDMEHLGSLDVYVAMQGEKVNTQFYLPDEERLDFLSEHMDLLTERLNKRGYSCDCKMQVRTKEKESGGSNDNAKGTGGIHELLAQAGHTSLASYAFDVRA